VTRLAGVPTLSGAPVLGLWPALARDILAVLEEVRGVEGDLVRLATPGGPPLLVAKHPRDIRRIVVDNAEAYGRTPYNQRLKIALGDGLFTSEGTLWGRQRRRLQPLFHARVLKSYAPMMASRTGELVASWRDAATRGAIVEAERDLSHLAMTIVGDALFGDETEHGAVFDAVADGRAELARRMFWPIAPPRWVPVPGKRRLDTALGQLEAEIAHIHSLAGHENTGLVGQLTRDGEMPAALVRDEVMTFFLAGHETSAAALAWAVHLLAVHPEVQAELAEEVRAVFQGGDVESAHAVERLLRVRAAVDETLRLYPAGAWLSRRLLAADTLAGVDVPAGALVILSPWLTQRDARWWGDPVAFRPERFGPDAPKPAPMSYFPFGAGPRICIGMGFARMEMTIALALILKDLRLHPDGEPPRPRAEITLRPTPSLRLRVSPRD